MHYYDCYIFASAAAAALTVTFIIGRKDKIKRRTCAVVCVIALLYSINMFCQRDNFSLEGYNKMLSSRTVIAGGETVELPQMNGCVILGDVTARPVYAMGGDVTEICTLESRHCKNAYLQAR